MEEQNRPRFEQVYGPEGRWAQFFQSGSGFIRTALVRDASDPLKFMTLDFWRSAAEYDQFRQKHRDQYAQIDAECEALTHSEKKIGHFEEQSG